ncbi:thermonuclease family protein [Novosphingobium aquiterrae]|uniref:Thermonuclease family protein n=1 Tax=Novosphingobium aquiterrae TaxID=624388 RepID=A0ABV6PEN6_9SPHN
MTQPAQAQALRGTAVAVDGDSLEVGGTRIRLFGIDAPEFDQTCKRNGETWSCGKSAKDQLAALVAGQEIECQGQGVDQYGRVLAVCWAGRDELNEAVVTQGWAVAYRDFSDAYIPAETRAKASRLGIWSSTFALPSAYRLSKLEPAPAPVPESLARPMVKAQPPTWTGGCAIKGNRNRRGQWIYHLPGMPYYDRTRAEEMFCTEAQAQAAGYRRAIVQ